jgi:NADH-quinone oxidoreductase subunit C
VADLFRQSLPDLEFKAIQTPMDVALVIRREDFTRVMEAAKSDERLAFDFLRCLSGVDLYTGLEAVYHLYSYRLGHSVAIKVRFPYEDPHLSTVTHLWQTADWHERETRELMGIEFDGHPDLRPLLTEEGLDYFVLRKDHPLAEIEESQEEYLKGVEELKAQMAVGAPEAAPVDERAAKIALAQKKSGVIKKAREEARAKGLSREDEKAAVQAALKRLEEEQAAAAAAPAAAPKPVDQRAAKIALAQKKSGVIKKAREEARAKGLSREDEKAAVQAALKRLEEEQAAATAAALAPPPPAADSRASKIALAQKKAGVIKKAREEARAKGLSREDEKAAVKAALDALARQQEGG